MGFYIIFGPKCGRDAPVGCFIARKEGVWVWTACTVKFLMYYEWKKQSECDNYKMRVVRQCFEKQPSLVLF